MKHTIVFHSINFAKRLQKAIGFKAAPLFLSYSEATALLIIDSSKNTIQKEIATKLNLEPASVVNLLDKLEKLNLVKREITKKDRRKHQISLTKEGQKAVRQIQSKALSLDNYLKRHLSVQELQNFTRTLEKLSELISKWKGGEKNEIPHANRRMAV